MSKRGWKHEPARHSLASKGVKTKIGPDSPKYRVPAYKHQPPVKPELTQTIAAIKDEQEAIDSYDTLLKTMLHDNPKDPDIQIIAEIRNDEVDHRRLLTEMLDRLNKGKAQ